MQCFGPKFDLTNSKFRPPHKNFFKPRTSKITLNLSEGSKKVFKKFSEMLYPSLLKKTNFCVSHEKLFFSKKNNVKY